MCYIGACRRLQGRANFHGYVCIGEVGLSLGNVTSIDIQISPKSGVFSVTQVHQFTPITVLYLSKGIAAFPKRLF